MLRQKLLFRILRWKYSTMEVNVFLLMPYLACLMLLVGCIRFGRMDFTLWISLFLLNTFRTKMEPRLELGCKQSMTEPTFELAISLELLITKQSFTLYRIGWIGRSSRIDWNFPQLKPRPKIPFFAFLESTTHRILSIYLALIEAFPLDSNSL